MPENFNLLRKENAGHCLGMRGVYDYLYGQREITVESEHKPLEAILKKPIHQAPLGL